MALLRYPFREPPPSVSPTGLGGYRRGKTSWVAGFELNADERAQILSIDPACNDVILPLYNGQDLNTMATLELYRWIIYFGDWPRIGHGSTRLRSNAWSGL